MILLLGRRTNGVRFTTNYLPLKAICPETLKGVLHLMGTMYSEERDQTIIEKQAKPYYQTKYIYLIYVLFFFFWRTAAAYIFQASLRCRCWLAEPIFHSLLQCICSGCASAVVASYNIRVILYTFERDPGALDHVIGRSTLLFLLSPYFLLPAAGAGSTNIYYIQYADLDHIKLYFFFLIFRFIWPRIKCVCMQNIDARPISFFSRREIDSVGGNAQRLCSIQFLEEIRKC